MLTTLDEIADIESFEVPAKRNFFSGERLVNIFAGFTQYITWPFLFILFHIFFDLRINGRRNFKLVKKPFIVIANHIAFYDSFVFRSVLGLFTTHLPFRFMAVTKFEKKYLNNLATIGIIDLIYSLFGVFTITPGLGLDRNLKKAKDIIKVGGNIVVYPEGKIFKGDTVGPFKRGAAALMKETGVSMIPVAFRLSKGFWIRKKLTVNIGGPMHILPNGSIDEITESFHETVKRLYDGCEG